MAEFVAELLGELFLPFLDLSPIDDHVVLASLAVDLNPAEREIFDTHGEPRTILRPTRLVVQFEQRDVAVFSHGQSSLRAEDYHDGWYKNSRLAETNRERHEHLTGRLIEGMVGN
jgi:hypothetical protein